MNICAFQSGARPSFVYLVHSLFLSWIIIFCLILIGKPSFASGEIAISSAIEFNDQTPKAKDWYLDLTYQIVREQTPELFKRVPQDSWENMALALEYAEVDSMEKAAELDLKLVPPGPVFHTWSAIRETTIFNGDNNTRGLNYVEKIRRESEQLNRWGIPLFIVYTELGLSEWQVLEMENQFTDSPNIVVLNLESDLRYALPTSPEYIFELQSPVMYMDLLRIVVTLDFPNVLDIANHKAILQNKKKFVDNLLKTGSHSICYTDMDNDWRKAPPYLLTTHGMVDFPRLTSNFVMNYESELVYLEGSTDHHEQSLYQHISLFLSHPYFGGKNRWSENKIDASYYYLQSGRAWKTYTDEQARKPNGFRVGSDQYWFQPIWIGDNGHIQVTRQSLSQLRKNKSDIIGLYTLDLYKDFLSPDFDEHDLSMKHNGRYKAAREIMGLQLWRYLHSGHDATWDTKRRLKIH